MMRVDLRDIAILANLIEGEHDSKITGLSIPEFRLDRKPNTIYKRLLRLKAIGYVAHGFPTDRWNRYYITPKGITFYEEAVNEK